MLGITSRTINLEGSNYEIGYKLGEIFSKFKDKKILLDKNISLKEEDLARVKVLLKNYSPGIVEEIEGFSDRLGLDSHRVLYYAMSYLKPACSQIALSKTKTDDEHVLLIRNYEFTHWAEDFILARTKVDGKYSHMGTSELFFGRDDGINEEGLAISMSACGQPVGAVKEMRRPSKEGLQFWVAIRGVLENCRNVDEGIDYLRKFPLASNVNFILADKNNKLGLFNIIDGDIDIEIRDEKSKDGFLHITNHFDQYKMEEYGQLAMDNSLKRYEMIDEFVRSKDRLTRDEIKAFLLEKYPRGLSFNDYDGFFGTTKSIIMDCSDGSLEILWGGRKENLWNKYKILEKLEDGERKIFLNNERLEGI